MALIPVSSSAIRAVGYGGSTLAVLFHTSDTIYTRPGVPLSVFLGLMQASSMGLYYNQHIRGKINVNHPTADGHRFTRIKRQAAAAGPASRDTTALQTSASIRVYLRLETPRSHEKDVGRFDLEPAHARVARDAGELVV